MKLTDLGFTGEYSEYLNDPEFGEFSIGRIIQENRERYILSDGETEYDAEITGNLRYSSGSRSDFPAVGDWVTFKSYNSDQAIIHKVLPRRSVMARQAVGKHGEIQIIATNIDIALIVQSAGINFNLNRLERYLSVCFASGIEPLIVISKIDLHGEEEIREISDRLEKREKRIRYIMVSNISQAGLDQLSGIIQKGKTYCVVGSSGVGKSTLINNLLKKNMLKTGNISTSTNKGRHITEHRELFVLENGGIIIDNPGMKELGMTDDSEGIKTTFQDITELAWRCQFPDCSHRNESGCAVIEAVEKGSLDSGSYENYLKLMKEQERFHSTVAEKRKKDKKLSKIIKNYYKDMGRNTDQV